MNAVRFAIDVIGVTAGVVGLGALIHAVLQLPYRNH